MKDKELISLATSALIVVAVIVFVVWVASVAKSLQLVNQYQTEQREVAQDFECLVPYSHEYCKTHQAEILREKARREGTPAKQITVDATELQGGHYFAR